MNSVPEVLLAHTFLNITCLSLWLNSLESRLKGAWIFAWKYALSSFSFVSARSFLFMLLTFWIILCWAAYSNKFYFFSVWSLGLKPWLWKCLSDAALWAAPLAWSVAVLCCSHRHLFEVHQTSCHSKPNINISNLCILYRWNS